MRTWVKVALSVAIGIAVPVAWAFIGHITDVEWPSWIFLFPLTLLESLLPHPNIGTPEQPFYEGTPLDFAAVVVGLPLSVLFNSVTAYFVIRAVNRRRR